MKVHTFKYSNNNLFLWKANKNKMSFKIKNDVDIIMEKNC